LVYVGRKLAATEDLWAAGGFAGLLVSFAVC
jgi:hypothetical protein